VVHRFHSPSNGNGLFWYSFDVGPVHVVYYSTEHDFRRPSEQYRWLENDLRSVDRQQTPWLIVGGHRPMYSSLVGVDLIRVMLQLHVEPLLYKYHVDLNMFAHIHSYERTCPMYQQRCVSDGVTHILMGMGGHDLSYGSYLDEPWSIFHDIQFGYTHLSANRTHLNFYYYHTFADDQPADHFQLEKN
jgi:acid phosphatase type 7